MADQLVSAATSAVIWLSWVVGLLISLWIWYVTALLGVLLIVGLISAFGPEGIAGLYALAVQSRLVRWVLLLAAALIVVVVLARQAHLPKPN